MRDLAGLFEFVQPFLAPQELLDAANGVALAIEQAMDGPCQVDVGGAVVAAVAGAFSGRSWGNLVPQ